MGQPEPPVVRSSPEKSGFHRRFGQRIDDTVVFRAAPGRVNLAWLVAGEIGADDFVVLRLIRQAKNMVAREVEHALLVLAADERCVPVKTVTFLAFRGFRAQIALFTGAKIDPVNETFLAFGVENVAIGRIENDVKSIAALERDPIGIANTFFARHLARPDKALVIL